MDVIQLAQAGFGESVAALGTAVTSAHVNTLLRITDHVIFAFDGDAAGRKAARRALEATLPAIGDGKRASFVLLAPRRGSRQPDQGAWCRCVRRRDCAGAAAVALVSRSAVGGPRSGPGGGPCGGDGGGRSDDADHAAQRLAAATGGRTRGGHAAPRATRSIGCSACSPGSVCRPRAGARAAPSRRRSRACIRGSCRRFWRFRPWCASFRRGSRRSWTQRGRRASARQIVEVCRVLRSSQRRQSSGGLLEALADSPRNRCLPDAGRAHPGRAGGRSSGPGRCGGRICCASN